MPKLVAIWNSVGTMSWEQKLFTDRIPVFRAAVAAAGRYMQGLPELDGEVQCIFLAPEYTFARPGRRKAKPAVQVNQTYLQNLLAHLVRLSMRYPSMLLVPGTIATLENFNQARNRCLGAFAGERVFDFSKKNGLGEVDEGDGLVFMPGTGYDLAALGGDDYGAEICRDATLNTMPCKVNYHLAVGQGVGQDWIVNHATDYLIVADPFNSGVFRATKKKVGTKGQCQEIHDYETRQVLGCEIYFYVID